MGSTAAEPEQQETSKNSSTQQHQDNDGQDTTSSQDPAEHQDDDGEDTTSEAGDNASGSKNKTQRTLLITTLVISMLAVLYRNVDLRYSARFDVHKARVGLTSQHGDQRLAAAKSVLAYAGVSQFSQQLESSGIPELLVDLYRSDPYGDTPEFAATCTQALVRLCAGNGVLCKRLLKSYDLVRQSFKKLDAGLDEAEQAAVYSFLAVLGPHSRVVAKKLSQPDTFASLVDLLQSSAATKSHDMVAGVSQLLAFSASVDDLRQKVFDTGALYTWIQVAQAQADDAATGASFAALVAVAAYDDSAVDKIVNSGVPAAIVGAVKQQSNSTTGAALMLAMCLAGNEMGRWTLVNNNMLSICAQMWYSGKVMYHWRMGCAQLLITTAGLTSMQEQIPASKQPLASLMTLARDVEHPAMQNAALDAIRDIAHIRTAAVNMAETSVIASIINLLGTTVPKESPDKPESEEIAGWHLRSRRAIAATIALLSTHQDLRPAVLHSHGAAALVAIIHNTPGSGLAAQTRIAAAAALVALAQDVEVQQHLVAAGSIEVLTQMFKHPATRQEQETAAAALKLLQRASKPLDTSNQKTDL